jgi:hypothetical protein
MRTFIFVLLLSFAFAAGAREWKSDSFQCGADLPESAGWEKIEAPGVPGLKNLVVLKNDQRQSVFGITVVEDMAGTNLAEPAVRQKLELMLRKLGYQFAGHANVKVGNLDWLQYSVRAGAGAQQTSGIIRFAAVDERVFGITMLRGGAQAIGHDEELQKAAASFRVLPAHALSAQQLRLVWYAAGGLIVLILFIKIVGGGKTVRRVRR